MEVTGSTTPLPKSRIVSKPGACITVRVIEMPDNIKAAIGLSLALGKRAAASQL